MDKLMKEGKTNFLIDGYPRNEENATGWKEVIGDSANVRFVLFFECGEKVMTERLLSRAKSSGKVDDNEEAIKKRFNTYRSSTQPVIDDFAKRNMVRTVNA